MDRIEGAIRVVLAFHEALNRHDTAAMMALMSADCVFENTAPAPNGAVYTGKAAVTQFWRDFFAASPEAHFAVEEVFGMGMRYVKG
jgi:ketosteroid isomerase-like protein